eukprot:TRINITY_DN108333_c0_g1_i1.p1 TRINITY_DN108333_c0_g1~~TRINITY_DN108333_c0_g1_i1.p1  ORF type:complete len:470 (+),score=32.45 TRINITY_DN108333_c0_g1_i1:15-1424(+)
MVARTSWEPFSQSSGKKRCAMTFVPSIALNVHCATGRLGLGSLDVGCSVNPHEVDVVSFMVARAHDPDRWPYLHYTVPVEIDQSGHISASIESLQAGQGYLAMARAHKRGAVLGWPLKWSNVDHNTTPCIASQETSDVALKSLVSRRRPHPQVRTRWIEVYRHRGSHYPHKSRENFTLPDYLDNHNGGDAAGIFSKIERTMWGSFGQHRMSSSFTRYCVQLEDKTFQNVTTVVPSLKFKVDSKFANYFSCMHGRCRGVTWQDLRELRPKPELLRRLCPNCGWHLPAPYKYRCVCNNTQAWAHASLRYVGMRKFHDGGEHFSFPLGGFCPPGAQVGDQHCTWALAPTSYSVSLATMERTYGVFIRGAPQQWAANASHAFMQLGAKPCGSSADLPQQMLFAAAADAMDKAEAAKEMPVVAEPSYSWAWVAAAGATLPVLCVAIRRSWSQRPLATNDARESGCDHSLLAAEL